MDISELTWNFTGGDDFVSVVDVDFSESYEWDEFHAWYSPSKRRYFWGSGSGCSCNSWGEEVHTTEDLENGPKDALERSLRSYLEGVYYKRPADVLDAMTRVKAFRPSRYQH